MEIILAIQKTNVILEVKRTTSYTGAKIEGGDADAFNRIRTVDGDTEELGRFWNECRSEIAKVFKHKLVSEGMYSDSTGQTPSTSGDYYVLKLNVANSLGAYEGGFNSSLLPSMELGLFSFFVNSITAKWYIYTNKKEVGDYAAMATSLLEDLRQKVFSQKVPKRPTYN